MIPSSGFFNGGRREKASGQGLDLRDRAATAWTGGGFPFVGSEKRILRRVIREAGVVLTTEAQARLDALPEQFLEFTAAPPSLDVAA